MEDRDTDTGTTGGSVKAESKGRINSPIYQGYDHGMIRNLVHEPESCHLVVVTVIRNLAQFRNFLCSKAHYMNTSYRALLEKQSRCPQNEAFLIVVQQACQRDRESLFLVVQQ
jgi:hypothetical protein